MLKTKFHKPTITANIIYRDRIADLLNKNYDKSLILVSAPAGYGKSIAVSHWMDRQKRPYAWLFIDEHLNNFTVFLEYFIEALRKLRPSREKNLSALLQASSLLSHAALAEKICNEILDAKESGILVLDDYYLINNPSIHELINYLVENCPNNQQLVIVSRYDPPLKLKRLRLYGNLVEVRIADLIIDEQEFRRLLSRFESKMDKGASEILKKSEGWILGIIMLLNIEAIKGGNLDYLGKVGSVLDMDFLLDEYLPYLPKSFSEPLLLASYCNRFNQELLEALFQNHLEGKVDVPAFISNLKEYNLFLVSGDGAGGWYRFHHLFSEVLRRKQPKNSRVLKFLSSWYASKGYIKEAIDCAIRNKDDESAVDLVGNHWREAYNKGQWWRIKEWLHGIPLKLIRGNPSLLTAHICVLENFWDIREIDDALFLLKNLIRGSGDPEKSEYYFHRSYYELFCGTAPEEVLKIAMKSKALHENNHMLGARRELVIGLSRQMQGEVTECLKTLDEIENRHHPQDIIYLRSYSTRILVLLLSGRFALARQASKRYLYLAENTFQYIEAWSHYFAANIAFQRFDSSQDLSSLRRIYKYEDTMDRRAYMDGYAGLCIYLLISGDIDAAKRSLLSMGKRQRQIKDGLFSEVCISTQMRFHWLLGEKHKALRWATEKMELEINPVDPLFTMEVPELTRIRILITFGNMQELQSGLDMLDSLDTMLQSVHNEYHTIDILLLKALAFYRMSDQSQSELFLEQAFEVYARQKITRPFRELVRVAPQLFENAEHLPSGLRQIIPTRTRSHENVQVLMQIKSKSSDELTRREIQIVRLATLGLQNKEIADQLNISIATVKSHLSNIYQKLDVHNRTSMISKIQKFNLYAS